LNNLKHHNDFEREIFDFNISNFEDLALELFRFQYQYNPVYNRYVNTISVLPRDVKKITQIPFLPISFFKTHEVTTTEFSPEAVFESSGTTQTSKSRHYVKYLNLYKRSFQKAFDLFYGDPAGWCIIGLLPSYLERSNSSLVAMTEELIRMSADDRSGFYLNEYGLLNEKLLELEAERQKTLLIGVTFALLDFAEKHPIELKHTILMETGGMKGKKVELTRQQVHEILINQMGVPEVHSEYGMTELLSQSYSKSNGFFSSPPWMRILLRNEDDPFSLRDDLMATSSTPVTGIINVIDMANIYSCAFIATDDLGKIHHDGSFEVMGRLDHSDIRGCNLLF
jgi:Acyl-protein synthetase, LuxE